MSEDKEVIFEAARRLDAADRSAYLLEACAENDVLRIELESLLEAADAAERYFERLQAGTVPELAQDLMIGKTVGHYRILSHIGSGGMGSVYRAEDMRLNREIALKFLSGPPGTSARTASYVLDEARAAASLQHSNVCVVHDIGETDEGLPFIAMALCRGQTLRERLREGPMSVEVAISTAIQIARGLGAAHARRIVHRDVKPGNVMIDPDGGVKLLDFGVARTLDVTVTGPGSTPGTIAYMAPEQVRGETVDQRSDLWALGVVLYEMLSGMRPFRGGNDRAMFNAILNEREQAIRDLRSDVPERLSAIVHRLLSKDPRKRYQTAAELESDLGNQGASRRRNHQLLAAGVLAATVVAAILIFSPRPARERVASQQVAITESSIAVLPFADLGSDSGDAALGDGITEELIAALARVDRLRVTARTSSFAFRNSGADVRRIANSLDVANLLEGSVRRSGSRLRVQVRLVDAASGSTRWSETYDRDIHDIFNVQSDIAGAVARELDLRLRPSAQRERRPLTDNIAAYELYLRGRDPVHFRSPTDSGPRTGLAYLQQAVELDPKFAAAYANMAYMYFGLSGNGDRERDLALKRMADSVAHIALALDSMLPEAHMGLAVANGIAPPDLTVAEASIRRALALGGAPRAREQLARVLVWTGRPREGLEEALRAAREDPLSASAAADIGRALCINGRYDEGIAQLRRVGSLKPPLQRVRLFTAICYAMKGSPQKALGELAGRRHPRNDALTGFLLARMGATAEARRAQAQHIERWNKNGAGAFPVAMTAAGLRDYDEALEWMEKASAEMGLRDEVIYIVLDELRADPRFRPILQKHGFWNR